MSTMITHTSHAKIVLLQIYSHVSRDSKRLSNIGGRDCALLNPQPIRDSGVNHLVHAVLFVLRGYTDYAGAAGAVI